MAFGKVHGKLVSCQHLSVRRLTYTTVGAGFILEDQGTRESIVIDLSRDSQTRGTTEGTVPLIWTFRRGDCDVTPISRDSGPKERTLPWEESDAI